MIYKNIMPIDPHIGTLRGDLLLVLLEKSGQTPLCSQSYERSTYCDGVSESVPLAVRGTVA